MEWKKNDIVIVEILDMTESGEGVGKAEGFPLFIKDTVIGDRVEARVIKLKKTYGYGKLLRVISPSPDRVTPLCPAASPCGGCQLQALSYEKQLAFKEKKVAGHLERIGKQEGCTIYPIIGMEDPWHYRNKAQFPVTGDKDGRIRMGFYAGRTHSVIETEKCYIGHPKNEEILVLVKSYMEEAGEAPYEEESHTGLVRHVLIRVARASGEVMVCLVINGDTLKKPKLLVEKLLTIEGMTSISYNINRERTNVILGSRVVDLYGNGYITDKIGNISYQISPLSFYQVNSVQTEKLYGEALKAAMLTGEETVWDLYCGIGTISLFLAQKAKKVYGVELVPQAIENASSNARLNGIENVEFFVGRAEEVLPGEYEKNQAYADVIVVDPPRKGCDGKLLDTMIQMKPKRIVYVSCDSATLARDVKYLTENGYELKFAQPVDMFPMSTHVETVVLLSHKKPDGHINVKAEFGEGEGKVPLD